MKEREEEGKERDAPPRTPARAPGPAAPLSTHAEILRLSATAGNAAVARAILARHGDDDHDHAPEAGGGATGTVAPPPTQAAAEAKALETWGLLRAVYRAMLASADTSARNTGQMIDPPGERDQGHRFKVTPMTLRSDSAQLVSDRGDNAVETAYYFYGSTQDNEHRAGPRTIGTVTGGNTVVIRGHSPSTDTLRAQDDVIATLVHEVSHRLVSGYGEHADTDRDSGSFDRYKDEFRAYFVEPRGMGDWGSLTDPDLRADAIKAQLVGTDATHGGYPDIRANYWREPLDTNDFRRRVDAHRRPDGFNLTNSPRLDRLVSLFTDQRQGRATVEDIIWQIAVIPAAERAEAAGATLISGLVGRMQAADGVRVRRALTDPRAVGYGREMNPRETAHITAVLDAIAAGTVDPMKEAYQRCDATERGEMYLNAHLFVWIDHAMPDPLTRACVYGMINGRSALMFDAVREFMRTCEAAAADATLTEIPAAMRAALRRMTFETRLSFYRMSEDAYRAKVEPLPEAIRRPVRSILRGEADP